MNKNKHYRLRLRLIIFPLLISFLFLILFKFLLPDYFKKINQLDTGNSVIVAAFKNKFKDYEKGRTIYRSCVDIELADKSYIIRITDHLTDNFWDELINNKNINKAIEYKFSTRLLQDKILFNPEQIAIDNKVIIPYNSKKTFTGWTIIIMFTVSLGFLISTILSFRTYKRDLLDFDKKLWRKNKLKLIGTWLGD